MRIEAPASPDNSYSPHLMLTAPVADSTDSIKTLIEVLAKKKLATHEEFAEPYRQQRDAALKAHNGHGAGVFDVLVKFCEAHGPLHALHRAPPGGSA